MQKEDTENTGRILIAGAGIGGLEACAGLQTICHGTRTNL